MRCEHSSQGTWQVSDMLKPRIIDFDRIPIMDIGGFALERESVWINGLVIIIGNPM
jgi:hypothetical protein